MQAVTAKDFVNLSIVEDLKEVCGKNFELIEPRLRLAVLATLAQFQLLKHLTISHSTWELMEEDLDSIPIVVWANHREVKAQLLRCWQLNDGAIAHLIQQLAENL